MLHYVLLELSSITASFRNPDFQNFHKSFSLPPPTTIVGLAGAAMGLDPLQAQTYFDDNEVLVSISGRFTGKSNDLWKYNDFKNGSVILREILFGGKISLVFASEDKTVVECLKGALLSPVYALSWGPNDSLLRIGKDVVSGQAEVSIDNPPSFSLVEGDVVREAFEQVKATTNFNFSISDRSATAVSLPIRFNYESGHSVRRVKEKRIFSFVYDTGSYLTNVKRSGVLIGDIFFHLFRL